MNLKLFACGDIVNSKAKNDFVNDDLKEIIRKCDFSICNFEAPIQTHQMKPIKKAGPHLYQSKESIEHLKNAGFNIVSVANNHIYDYGQTAFENTLKELNKYDIDYVGGSNTFDEAYKGKILQKNGIKIGLLAACENEFGCLYENQSRGGYAWLFHPLIEDNIRVLSTKTDVIVLIAHAGVESIDLPIKEWRDRYKRLCDVGVNVIIGHHPHVPHGYETYNNSTIFYSLGNFYFDTAGFQDKKDDSYSVILEFEKTGLKNFEVIYHKKIDGQTCKVNEEDVTFSINFLNYLLQDNYINRNNEICIELFKNYYYRYYENAIGLLHKNATFIETVKHLVEKLLFKDKNSSNRNLLLLHNIRIESHRFVVQRALSLNHEKYNLSNNQPAVSSNESMPLN